MLERLVLRPELNVFEAILADRIGLVAGLEDERFAKPRAIERDVDDRLVVVSDYVSGRRLSEVIDAAAEHGIVAGLDAGIGLLLELLPAISRIQDAGLVLGTLAPGRIIITPTGQVVILDTFYGVPLERLQLTRMRLWSEFRLAFPPTAGLARFDRAADLAHASIVAATLTVGRPLQDGDYPDGIANLRKEIHEIASIRGTKGFADAMDKFFASTLPVAGRKNTPPSADEAAIDLRKLVRKDLGINTCRDALIEFLLQVETADAERVAADISTREAQVAGQEVERVAREDAERKSRDEGERKAREKAERKAREEAERKAREEAERKAREESERKAREEAERKAREEAERKAREEAERKAREEAERKAREEAERKAREEAERKAREEAERKAREEAERKAREQAERRAREEAERKAREEAERKAREEAERKARDEAERQAREEVARRAREDAERKEREEAERKAKEEAERVATAEASRKRGGWLISPENAAKFDPPVPPATPPPAPAAMAPPQKPYPIYVAPAQPAAFNASLPVTAPPITEIIPSLASPSVPPPSAVIPLATAAPAQGGIRLKGAEDTHGPSTRGHQRSEPVDAVVPAADAYGYAPPTDGRQVPWKLIAAGAVLIAAVVGVWQFGSSARPVVDTVKKAIPTKAENPPDTVDAPVAANVGRLVLTTQPTGAKIQIDGKDAGETPLTIENVKPGRHTLTITGTEGVTKRTVRVEAGKVLEVDVALYPGFVAVSAPIVVTVAEGGKVIGTSENQIILSPGRHDLRLTNKELGYSATETVDITSGEVARINVDPMGRANINAAPWAEVWVDGVKIGDTPLANVAIRLGVREVVFKNPQYPDRKQTITVVGGPAATILVDFNKQ
jgi:chemotaxis protein histidine kinase CheA